MKAPYTPLLYSKTGVYRGIHIFLIFALKHRLLVLVRTMFCAKIRKNITIFHLKIIIFTAVKNCCILHGRVYVISESANESIDLEVIKLCSCLTHLSIKCIMLLSGLLNEMGNNVLYD